MRCLNLSSVLIRRSVEAGGSTLLLRVTGPLLDPASHRVPPLCKLAAELGD